MPKTETIHTVTVEGRSPFPIDMLRYDRAIPDSEHDSATIARTYHTPRRGSAIPDTPWSVKVSMPRDPAIGRWVSFGWRVTEINTKSFPR